MPTNTHTFFYKKMVKDVAKTELMYYKDELTKLTSRESLKMRYNNEWVKDSTQIRNLETKYKSELNDPTNIGQGVKAVSKLQDIERELNAKPNTLLYNTSINQKECNQIADHNHKIISELLQTNKKQRDVELQTKLKNFDKEAHGIRNTINNITRELNLLNKEHIHNEKTSIVKHEIWL